MENVTVYDKRTYLKKFNLCKHMLFDRLVKCMMIHISNYIYIHGDCVLYKFCQEGE